MTSPVADGSLVDDNAAVVQWPLSGYGQSFSLFPNLPWSSGSRSGAIPFPSLVS